MFLAAKKIIEANGIIEQIGRKYECRYINLHSLYAEDNILPNRYTADGVHLLPDAYKNMVSSNKRLRI